MLSMSVISEREGGFSHLPWFSHRGSAVRDEEEREGLLIDNYVSIKCYGYYFVDFFVKTHFLFSFSLTFILPCFYSSSSGDC